MDKVILDKGAEENGLATMVSDLIRQNISQNSKKMSVFNRTTGIIVIEAVDADVKITLDFKKGRLTVYDGEKKKPKMRIITDSESIIDMSRLKIRFGLPYFFDETGLLVVKKLLTGKLKIKGLIFHPLLLVKVANIVSVY